MTTRLLRACAGLLLLIVGVSASAAAQAPASQDRKAGRGDGVRQGPAAPATTRGVVAPVPPVVPPPPAVERPTAPEPFTYKPEGRRDPFLSLVNRAITSEARPMTKRPEGVPGLSWDEIALRGIFHGPKGPVALVQGPDTKTYQVHVGDRFFDAVVKAITPDSLVVLQEVNDPLSLQKQRESRKTLRVAEEVK